MKIKFTILVYASRQAVVVAPSGRACILPINIFRLFYCLAHRIQLMLNPDCGA